MLCFDSPTRYLLIFDIVITHNGDEPLKDCCLHLGEEGRAGRFILSLGNDVGLSELHAARLTVAVTEQFQLAVLYSTLWTASVV